MKTQAVKLFFSLALGFSLIALNGCYKITFKNGSKQQAPLVYIHEKWHHDGVLGLVEFSDPVNLKMYCDNKSWSAVQTHMTFVQGLVSGITYGLYNPWNAAFSCR